VLSCYVLAGVMSRSEARRGIGFLGRLDADELLVPVNAETVDQARQRQDRADDQAAAATAAALNTNIAASLTRLLDGLRPSQSMSPPVNWSARLSSPTSKTAARS
jgi:hypothetical protein